MNIFFYVQNIFLLSWELVFPVEHTLEFCLCYFPVQTAIRELTLLQRWVVRWDVFACRSGCNVTCNLISLSLSLLLSLAWKLIAGAQGIFQLMPALSLSYSHFSKINRQTEKYTGVVEGVLLSSSTFYTIESNFVQKVDTYLSY